MNDSDGSKLMSIYIGICFLLAAGAGIAYKAMDDERGVLNQEYVSLNAKHGEIRVYSKSIKTYYRMVKSGEIAPVTEKTKRDTPNLLASIALDKLRLSTDRNNDQFDYKNIPDWTDKRLYVEYWTTVDLKRVRQDQWSSFIRQARAATSKWAVISEIRLTRIDTRYDRIRLIKSGSDRSLWNVTITLRWFSPPKKET